MGVKAVESYRGAVWGLFLLPLALLAAGCSQDLLTFSPWQVRSTGTQAYLWGIAYGNGVFVAVGEALLVSPDGERWQKVTEGVCLADVAFGDAGFVVPECGPWSGVLISQDGYRWQRYTLSSHAPINGIAYGNGRYVAVADLGLTYVSTDGLNWQRANGLGLQRYLDVTFVNGLFIRFDIDPWVSTDGFNWSLPEQNPSSTNNLYGGTYGKGLYVVVGSSGTVLTSTDARRWTLQRTNSFAGLAEVAYGNDRFVAVGSSEILSSKDGVEWVSEMPSDRPMWSLADIIYAQGKFVAVGSKGLVLTSTR
ncbi:hypothetical protein CSW27_09875 [Thermus scotoductus]|uniref:Cell wall-binding protein n=2 Tax=Thermus scotoductus TaxID=37636 RepID=A0A430UUS4_THESC|nr:hypothetical protein CSW27_09875 [Thermus scotoductus]